MFKRMFARQADAEESPADPLVFLPATGERVLIADDDPKIRQLLALVLHADGIEVLTAADGYELIRQAQECQPHLIVADIGMPRMDGYTAIRRLRSDLQTAHIPIVVLSARTSADDVVAAYEMGADEYIAKPFDMNNLREIVRAYLSRSRAVGEI